MKKEYISPIVEIEEVAGIELCSTSPVAITDTPVDTPARSNETNGYWGIAEDEE